MDVVTWFLLFGFAVFTTFLGMMILLKALYDLVRLVMRLWRWVERARTADSSG